MNGEIRVKAGAMKTNSIIEESGERMTPVEILKYVEELGKDLQRYALTAQAMLAIAEDSGIRVELTSNVLLGDFEARGRREIQLITMRSELISVVTDILSQGVRVSSDEVDQRLEKMGKPTTADLSKKD